MELWITLNDFFSSEKILSVVVSSVTTIIVLLLTLCTKRWSETRILSSKLETEYKYEQRKQIKNVLAKYKIHLMYACEDLNHRLWNFANNHDKQWLNVDGVYDNEKNYYFHSFAYRFLAVFSWIEKINKEIIFLDTTIASSKDLEFIKFVNVFSRLFCDLTFLEGNKADGFVAKDHFFRNQFEKFTDVLITENGIKSYSSFISDLKENKKHLIALNRFFDGLSPCETRKRWDRINFLHITLIAFLNNYGYDFQITKKKKIKEVLIIPKQSSHLDKYFILMSEYHLNKNKEIKSLRTLYRKQLKSNYRTLQ